MSPGKKWLIALGVGALIGAVWAGVIVFFGPDPRVTEALVLIDTGSYRGPDVAYFTDIFGAPSSEPDATTGQARSATWPLTDSMTTPVFLTVVFDESGHALDATVHRD